MTASPPLVVVAGIGNPMRHDDGVGLEVAARVLEVDANWSNHLRIVGVCPVADPIDLLWIWRGAQVAVVTDAARSGAVPGTLSFAWLTRESPEPLAFGGHPASSHSVGIAGVYRLGVAVERAPLHLILVGVEGLDFSPGKGLSAPVTVSIAPASRLALGLVRQALRWPAPPPQR